MNARLAVLLAVAITFSPGRCWGGQAAGRSDIRPSRLRCEHLVNPAAMDLADPRLSWELEAVDRTKRGLRQTAYRVLVASSPEKLAAGEGDLWDAGRAESDQTLNVEYRGKPLASRQQCWWKVQVWDQDGKPSGWSEAASWGVGLLKAEDWRAKWISPPPTEPKPTAHFGYRSRTARSQDEPKWVQIDLGERREIDGVRLWGAWPVERLAAPGDGFPVRFKIEAADRSDFSDARVAVDRTAQDSPNPGIEPLRLDFARLPARRVRLTATRLSGAWAPVWDAAEAAWKAKPVDRAWKLALAEMEVLSRGTNVALGKPVTALDSWDDDPTAPVRPADPFALGKEGWSRAGLTDGLTEADPGGARRPAPVTLFRRLFRVGKPVRRAILYASALGCYEFHLNGAKVGDHQLAPGWTIYSKRVLYQTYDVTRLLRPGPNVIGAMLADGWYRMRQPFDFLGGNKRFVGFWRADAGRLLGQLEIQYEDGSGETIATDRSWQCRTDGPIRRASIYDGVLYDARKEIPGWDQPEAVDSRSWQAVVEKPVGDAPALSAQQMAPIRILRQLKPRTRTAPKAGVYVYDFGEQLSGVCRIRVAGPAGTAVKLRYAEAIQPDGTIYVANLMGAYDNQDVFILDGREPKTFTPCCTYHGFRYVELSGVSSPAAVEEITALESASDVKRSAEFTCSDRRLNKLCAIVDRAYRSCMPSLTVDVAARDERLPWMGDCYADEAQSLAYMYDFAAFGANEHRAIADALSCDGIAPPHLAKVHGEDEFASAGWCDASVAAPCALWLNYADRRSLELGYDGAKRFMDAIYAQNPDGVPAKKYVANYGDWLSARMTIPPGAADWTPKGGKGAPPPLFAAAWWAYSAELVSQMAAALGKTEEARHYADMAAKIRTALVKNHVGPDGTIAGNEQSCYALALGMNHLNGELRKKAEARLLEAIRDYDEHLATGSITTIFLLKFLAESRRQDLAYRMVMQPTCPSYGFMVDSGATAMWERFDGWHPKLGFHPEAMNGFNHLGMNSVFEWIFGYVAGIRPDWRDPAYKHFTVAPLLGGGLTSMKSHYDSIRGRIESAYELKDGKLRMAVTVPPNTTAAVILPAATLDGVTESGQPLAKAQGVAVWDPAAKTVCLQSGRYEFAMRRTKEPQ